MTDRVRAWFSELPAVVRVVLVAQVLAHAAVVASAAETCLDLEAVLVRGEARRLLSFLLVSPTGPLRGTVTLAAQAAAWVAVGRAAEHRLGSAALLVRTALLAALSAAGVALFLALGLLVMLATLLLPVPSGVLAGATERLPAVHICPAGFSGVVAALAIVELAPKWVVVGGRYVLPGFFVVIATGVLLFPLGGFSLLLLHELGWAAGLLFVLLLAPRLPARFSRVAAWLASVPGFLPESPELPPEQVVDEVTVGELGGFVYQSFFAYQKSPFVDDRPEPV